MDLTFEEMLEERFGQIEDETAYSDDYVYRDKIDKMFDTLVDRFMIVYDVLILLEGLIFVYYWCDGPIIFVIGFLFLWIPGCILGTWLRFYMRVLIDDFWIITKSAYIIILMAEVIVLRVFAFDKGIANVINDVMDHMTEDDYPHPVFAFIIGIVLPNCVPILLHLIGGIAGWIVCKILNRVDYNCWRHSKDKAIEKERKIIAKLLEGRSIKEQIEQLKSLSKEKPIAKVMLEEIARDNLYATVELGKMYESDGRNVKAYESFVKAANAGNVWSMLAIGCLFYNGKVHKEGVKGKDYRSAYEWLKKASDNGNAYAQFLIGTMYEEGMGCIIDYYKAADWYSLAYNNGYSDGGARINNLINKNKLKNWRNQNAKINGNAKKAQIYNPQIKKEIEQSERLLSEANKCYDMKLYRQAGNTLRNIAELFAKYAYATRVGGTMDENKQVYDMEGKRLELNGMLQGLSENGVVDKIVLNRLDNLRQDGNVGSHMGNKELAEIDIKPLLSDAEYIVNKYKEL